jgi:hypothetical protein
VGHGAKKNPMNLNNWKYVAPVNTAGKPTGSAATYTPAKYLKPYFTKTSFLCPVPNAKDGKFGRSELREQVGGKNGYWSLKTGGTMTYAFSVKSNPGRMAVGQVHCQDNNELCKVVHEGGKLYVAVDLYGNYPLCAAGLGETIAVSISVKNFVLNVTAKVAGSTHEMSLDTKAKYSLSKGYFKFGVYATSENKGDYAINMIEEPTIKH